LGADPFVAEGIAQRDRDFLRCLCVGLELVEQSLVRAISAVSVLGVH
jgi:hypothetical protein